MGGTLAKILEIKDLKRAAAKILEDLARTTTKILETKDLGMVAAKILQINDL